jgi:hypothetical protein
LFFMTHNCGNALVCTLAQGAWSAKQTARSINKAKSPPRGGLAGASGLSKYPLNERILSA